MKILFLQFLEEQHPRNMILECDESDACPSCGAKYRVNITACDYCKTPVGCAEQALNEAQ